MRDASPTRSTRRTVCRGSSYWRDQSSVEKHLQRLLAEVGRERFVAFFEKTEAVRLTPIEVK